MRFEVPVLTEQRSKLRLCRGDHVIILGEDVRPGMLEKPAQPFQPYALPQLEVYRKMLVQRRRVVVDVLLQQVVSGADGGSQLVERPRREKCLDLAGAVPPPAGPKTGCLVLVDVGPC